MRVCQDWFPETDGFYMEDNLAQQLKILAKNVVDDWDFTIIITGQGEVRVGKSLLGLQIGAYWTWLMKDMHGIDIPFNVKDNICLQWEKLIAQGNNLGAKHKYCVLDYDEAGETMEGSKSQTSELKAVRDYLRECGQYNFLNILILPEFFDLPKGIAITRSTFLIDVYYSSDENGKFTRGYFKFYSRRNKKKLYMYGKKELNYNAHPYNFDGRFFKFYPVDEAEYRKAKQEALKHRESGSKDRLTMLRNAAWYLLSKEFGVTHKEIKHKMYELTGIWLTRQAVSTAIEQAGVTKGKSKTDNIILSEKDDDIRLTEQEEDT
jgi:hypothetical protein